PLNIDQSLDARDAIAKSLYSSLFSWLVQRINLMVYNSSKKTSIALLDIFGFENFEENNFEQLCINYANETLQYFFNKHVFRLEQHEYLKEKIEWLPITYSDNQNIMQLIAKKPTGIMSLLDDESNFPKASDQSFLEKCHFNHALSELYSRPRLASMEFGIKHFAGQVWYSVEGFLDKNRDTLRPDVISLLINSKMSIISKMFRDLKISSKYQKSHHRSDGRLITIKPRTPTVSSRFQDSLNSLLENMSKCNPWFVRCIKPNNDKSALKFDVTVVREQLRFLGILETIKIRKLGFPIRIKYSNFLERYKCLIGSATSRNMSSKEICKSILDRVVMCNDQYQLAATKVFMKENIERLLEQERNNTLKCAVIAVQKHVRTFLVRKKYQKYLRSVVKIQTAYRGHRCRQKYLKIQKSIICVQSLWRMKRQRRDYENIKAILARKRESEKAAIEKEKDRAAREEKEKVTRAVAGVNHLEIPAELA
ncbi:unconventional myosin-XV-like protein, partial [Leptotrombidium deliense]